MKHVLISSVFLSTIAISFHEISNSRVFSLHFCLQPRRDFRKGTTLLYASLKVRNDPIKEKRHSKKLWNESTQLSFPNQSNTITSSPRSPLPLPLPTVLVLPLFLPPPPSSKISIPSFSNDKSPSLPSPSRLVALNASSLLLFLAILSSFFNSSSSCSNNLNFSEGSTESARGRDNSVSAVPDRRRCVCFEVVEDGDEDEEEGEALCEVTPLGMSQERRNVEG